MHHVLAMAGGTGTRGPVLQSTQMQSASTTPDIFQQRQQKNYVFVDEHNRDKQLKVMTACGRCRRRKIKCSGVATKTWPCTACIRFKDDCDAPLNNTTMSAGWNSEQRSMFPSGGNAKTTPRASDHNSPYPHPILAPPHLTLSLDFRMFVTLNPGICIGPTPLEHRNWISFTGGSWSGSWGSGIVLPGGEDSQLITVDGSARLKTNYILQTFDSPPAYIIIKTHGWRISPLEVLAQLANPGLADKVNPNNYEFRLLIDMETSDERYKHKINCGMWVGNRMRRGAEVIYDAYRLS